MLELGKVSLKNNKYLIEKRNKLFDLAMDLGFGEVEVTRLTTAASEVIRSIAGADKRNGLAFFLEEKQSRLGLLLHFISANNLKKSFNVLENIFDETDYSLSEDGLNVLSAFKYIPDYSFKPTEDFLNTEREKIRRLTRDELFSELKNSYSKLKEEVEAHNRTERMLKIANVQAEAANKAKSEFLA